MKKLKKKLSPIKANIQNNVANRYETETQNRNLIYNEENKEDNVNIQNENLNLRKSGKITLEPIKKNKNKDNYIDSPKKSEKTADKDDEDDETN